jgi:uncharacterized protein (UPF0254 family)
MRQKLFTKQVDDMLFKQYAFGNDLSKQKVVAKIFNPYGSGVWYLLNSDPTDPDYIWAIVDLFEVEVGSVSRESLEMMKVPPFGLNLERDMYFQPINAEELFQRVLQGERFAKGGELQIIKNESGENYLASGDSKPNEMAVKLARGGGIENKFHEEVRDWIYENAPVKYQETSLDEIPRSVFTPTQLIEVDAFMDRFNSQSYADNDVKIKDWYMKNYPTDDLGEELNDEVTFEDMWNEDYKEYNIYQVMGVGDSVIRERLFEHLAEIKGVSYDAVYRKLFLTGNYAQGGGVDTIGFIPMDLEEKLALLSKWGGTNIKGVIGYLNAMIDSGVTDNDLVINPTKNTRFQRERAVEKKLKEIWAKIEPQYKGNLKGNMYYSTLKELIERNWIYENLLQKFKPFRKYQKFADGGMMAKDGGVDNYVFIALSKTKNGLLLSERFDKQITHKELFDYYKKRGYEIIDSNIFKVTNKDVLDIFKDAISKFIKEKYNELVDWENSFLSYEIIGDRIIAQSSFVQTKNGNEYKITPNDLVNKKFNDGGGVDNDASVRQLKKIKSDGKLIRYLDVRGSGKKLFDIIIADKSEKGNYKRYESTSKGTLGTLQNAYLNEEDVLQWLRQTSPKKMASGGVTFDKKVSSISKSLLKRKKVSPSVQKDYGKTYNKSEAKDSAKRIVGSMTKMERAKKIASAMPKKKN